MLAADTLTGYVSPPVCNQFITMVHYVSWQNKSRLLPQNMSNWTTQQISAFTTYKQTKHKMTDNFRTQHTYQ